MIYCIPKCSVHSSFYFRLEKSIGAQLSDLRERLYHEIRKSMEDSILWWLKGWMGIPVWLHGSVSLQTEPDWGLKWLADHKNEMYHLCIESPVRCMLSNSLGANYKWIMIFRHVKPHILIWVRNPSTSVALLIKQNACTPCSERMSVFDSSKSYGIF